VHECLRNVSLAKNIFALGETCKAPTATTMPLRTPCAESWHAQVKALLELTLPVKKIDSFAKFIVICTTVLSQLMVATG